MSITLAASWHVLLQAQLLLPSRPGHGLLRACRQNQDASGVQAWPGFCTEISASVAQQGGSNYLKVTLEGKRFHVAGSFWSWFPGDMEWIWSSHSDTALLYSEHQGNLFAFRAEQLWHTCRHQEGLVTHRRKGMQGNKGVSSLEEIVKAWLSVKSGGFFWLCPIGPGQEKAAGKKKWGGCLYWLG